MSSETREINNDDLVLNDADYKSVVAKLLKKIES